MSGGKVKIRLRGPRRAVLAALFERYPWSLTTAELVEITGYTHHEVAGSCRAFVNRGFVIESQEAPRRWNLRTVAYDVLDVTGFGREVPS